MAPPDRDIDTLVHWHDERPTMAARPTAKRDSVLPKRFSDRPLPPSEIQEKLARLALRVDLGRCARAERLLLHWWARGLKR